jgi:phage tail sheath protein FI
VGSQLLASKVVIVEEEPRIRNVPALATAVVGAVGITERGPVGQAVLVTSFEEFVETFGGFTPNSDLALAVQAFFQNGGQTMWVVRTVHYSDIHVPASKSSGAATGTIPTAALAPAPGSVLGTVPGPFDLEPGDTLVVAVDGGAPATATFAATAAARETGNAEPFALADGQTVTVRIDGGAVQAIAFLASELAAIGAATAAEVAAVINAKIAGAKATVTGGGTRVTITSDRRGTASSVEITGGTANAALGFALGPVAGTGNVANIDSVTPAEIKTIVEAAVAGVTVTSEADRVRVTSNSVGPSSSVQVQASSTADDELGLDNAVHSGNAAGSLDTLRIDGKWDGAYANDIRVLIAAATSGAPGEFNLTVEDNGLVVEVFPNLSMDDTRPNYVETAVNHPDRGSNLIRVTDLDAAASPPNDRPANGAYALGGGSDGLAGLDDNDFIGSPAAKTGLHALDVVQNVSLLIVPGRATAAMHNAMISYCEVTRDKGCFAILDPPANQSATAIVTYVEATAGLLNLSEFAAIYWPRVKIVNPSKTVFGNVSDLVVPPSGHLAGVYARVDSSRPGGVFIPPAGIENGRLLGVIGFETDEVLEETKRDLVFPKNINPLTTFPGAPRHVDGARTLKGDGNFPTVAERRGVIFIEQSLKLGLVFAKHQNNTPALRATLARTATAFLLIQLKNGAFASNDPKKAFFVDFGDALNPPSVVFSRQVVGRIGLATAKPAEFLILRFSQDTRAIEEELAAAAG